jgi:hypothetical protein
VDHTGASGHAVFRDDALLLPVCQLRRSQSVRQLQHHSRPGLPVVRMSATVKVKVQLRRGIKMNKSWTIRTSGWKKRGPPQTPPTQGRRPS